VEKLTDFGFNMDAEYFGPSARGTLWLKAKKFGVF
jgi:hypothetical protein